MSNIAAALNASRFNGTEIRKESYPLLLRNVGADVNGVKEYFEKIVHDDPEISGNRGEYVRELKAIERRMVIDMNANGDGMTKNGLIDTAYDIDTYAIPSASAVLAAQAILSS